MLFRSRPCRKPNTGAGLPAHSLTRRSPAFTENGYHCGKCGCLSIPRYTTYASHLRPLDAVAIEVEVLDGEMLWDKAGSEAAMDEGPDVNLLLTLT